MTILPPKNSRVFDAGVKLLSAIHDAGHSAYFVGGCVRDTIRGKEPKDWDIATSALPDQISEIFPGCERIGAHFGVGLVVSDGHTFEIATFRNDGCYSDGRHPDSVQFGTIHDDSARRDFTINAIYWNPVSGEIVDHFNGFGDINAGTLRCIGNPSHRFQEDALRLLRAIRFVATTGFSYCLDTYLAICSNKANLQRVSAERIKDKLIKILLSSGRVEAIQNLFSSGLLEYVIPELYDTAGCEQSPVHHPEGDVWTHTLKVLGSIPDGQSLELYLAALLHDIGKPATQEKREDGRITFHGHEEVGARMTREILTCLKFPNTTIDQVEWLVDNHMKLHRAEDLRRATLRRLLGHPCGKLLLELSRADCLGSDGDLSSVYWVEEKLKDLHDEPVLPEPIIRGTDLMTLGIQPGPRMGEILRQVQDAQLDGSVTDRESALEYVQNIL